MKQAKSKSIVSEVIRRMESNREPARSKRTLVLTKDAYEEFEKLCRGMDKYPSQVIDEFIKMFVEEKGE